VFEEVEKRGEEERDLGGRCTEIEKENGGDESDD
jgi:hypothetical protein